MEEDSNSDTENCTPPEIREAANESKLNLLPETSRQKYLNEYGKYEKWKLDNVVKHTSENVLLAYFGGLSKSKAPSTLWSTYSMLKATIDFHENIRINSFSKLIAFLKKQKKGFIPRKSKVFTGEEINKFLTEASDDRFLAMKVIAVFGLFGACRGCEFVNMNCNDVVQQGSLIMVKVNDTKNRTTRSFAIENETALIVKKYIALRPPNALSTRFFLGYKNGKCTVQVIGKHTFEKVPKQIAEFLGLEDPEKYTGHSFRRSSATVLVDAGANIETLKRHGGWKSSTVAEGYIADSIGNKRKTGSMIANMMNRPPTSKTAVVIPTSTVSKAPDSTSSPPMKKAKFSNSMISNMISLPTTTLTLPKATDQTTKIDIQLEDPDAEYVLDPADWEDDMVEPISDSSAVTNETRAQNPMVINITGCNFYFGQK